MSLPRVCSDLKANTLIISDSEIVAVKSRSPVNSCGQTTTGFNPVSHGSVYFAPYLRPRSLGKLTWMIRGFGVQSPQAACLSSLGWDSMAPNPCMFSNSGSAVETADQWLDVGLPVVLLGKARTQRVSCSGRPKK